MRKLAYQLATVGWVALLAPAAHATSEEQIAISMFTAPMYIFVAFVIIVIAAVYFMKWRDKRRAPLNTILGERERVHSVGSDTPVIECVRTMTSAKIGALMIIDGGKLVGIFTERDALNKVLAPGLDPVNTKVSAVMTKDPYCVSPTTTVGDAMEVVTKRRFRHLPVVENGRVLAVISSGDLTHWLVKDQVGEIQELVDLTARS